MKIVPRLKEFLEKKGISYDILPHPRTYTALETAEAEHVSGKKVAKVVMVMADEKPVMVVVPAHRKINFQELKPLLGAHKLSIDDEEDFMFLFPDCEIGAMPPFGNLYQVACIVDESVFEEDDIYFNAGSHDYSIRISTQDYARASDLTVGTFTMRPEVIPGW